MNTTTTKTTWKKLRSGDWGIVGPAADIVEGQTVTVTKKSGEAKTVTVGRVIWSNDTTAIATVTRTTRSATIKHMSAAPHSSIGGRRGRSCRLCGCTEPTCGGKGICHGPSFDPCFDCRA